MRLSPDAGAAGASRRVASKRAPANQSDEGTTLIEVLIAVLIVATAAVAMAAGLGTLAKASGSTRTLASEESYLRDVAEYIISPTDTSYVACGSSPQTQYQTVVNGLASPLTPPAGVQTASIAQVLCWNGSSGTPPTFSGTTDNGLEQIKITTSSTGSGSATTSTITVIKAKP